MMTPRGYQIEAHDATFREWETRRATLLEMATGTGKTVVFSLIAQTLVKRGLRVLILAHRDELILDERKREALGHLRMDEGERGHGWPFRGAAARDVKALARRQ